MSNAILKLKKVIACVAIMLVIAGCQKAEETKTQADIQSRKVLARVDGDPIYEGDIVRRIRVAQGIADSSRIDPNQWQKMIAAALESEIVDRLVLNAATAEGITADEQGVSHLINTSKTMLGEEKFKEMLDNRNSTEEEYRKFLEKRSLIKQYRDKLFAGIVIDEDALKRSYEGHEQSFVTPEKVRLEVIVIRNAEEADEIIQKVKAGEDFERVAGEYSLRGKEISFKRTDFLRTDAVPGDIQPMVKTSAPGTILGPLRSEEESRIYKVIDRQPSRVLTYEEAMQGSRDLFLKRRQQEVIDEWAASAKQKASIEYIR